MASAHGKTGLPDIDPGEAPYDEDRIGETGVTVLSEGLTVSHLSDQASVDREAAEWARL